MNSEDQINAKLDETFLSFPVEADDDFMEQTIALLHSSSSDASLDATLEKFLSRQPVEASGQFTADTLQHVRRAAKLPKKETVISFPVLTRWIGAAAAIIAIGFFIVQSGVSPLGNSTTRGAIPPQESLSDNTQVSIDLEHGNGMDITNPLPANLVNASGPQQFSDEYLSDLLTVELFMLAEPLSEVVLSLDDGAFDTLGFLTTQ